MAPRPTHTATSLASLSGVYGWSPRQDNLVSMCLDANDPAYTNMNPVATEQR
jgi:hypothetical protein